MVRQPPDPPSGVGDLHAQPGLESDVGLQTLQEVLEREVSSDAFDRLTRFVQEDAVPAEPTEKYRERALEYVTECIQYRDELRPESLREQVDLPDGISRTTVGGWVWYHNGCEGVEHDLPVSDADTEQHGKYLFFSPSEARALEDIVVEQFQERPFDLAKLPTIPAKKEDWVLCLYQHDNRYWYDLRERYNDPPRVRFRGFKTNVDTRQGEYSERFKSSS